MPVRDRALLTGALLLACALDFPGLFQGIWVDEWATLVATSEGFQACWSMANAEPPPPGHYVLTWLVFQVLPPGPASVRLLSLLAHAGAVAAVFRYAAAYHPRPVAFGAAYAVAANPIMGWFATNGRPYALIVLVAVLCVHAYRAERWWAFALASAALGWLHYFALLVPVLVWLWDAWARRGFPRAATAAGIGAFALWAPTAPHLLDKVVLNPFHPLAYEWFHPLMAFATLKWFYGLDALPLAAVLASVGGLTCWILLTSRFHKLESFLFFGGVGTICGLAWTVKPLYAPKLFLWTLPFAAVCVCSSLWQTGWKLLMVAWLAVVVAGGIAASGREKTGEKRAAQALAARIGPGDRVLLTAGTRGPVTWHLARMPWTGTSGTRTWLLDRKAETASSDPHADFHIHAIAGTPATLPTTWPAATELARGAR